MSAWDLPTTLEVGGRSWKIRSDYRAVLDILSYFNNPEYDNDEKWMICLDILFEDFSEMPYELYEEAAKVATEFIDAGQKDDGKPHPRLIDWEQDALQIVSAVNAVAHAEVRAAPYLHWWTFLGYFMEIGDSTISTVIHIRKKKSEGKKLDDWERDFCKNNKSMVEGYLRKNERSEEEKNVLRELFGYKKR